MTSSKPYLLSAFLDWIVDNRCTPYIVVDANYPDVQVPTQYVEDGRIVLNIAPDAIRDFELTKTAIKFNARFSGVPHELYAPMRAIAAIYAKENGRGMVFKEDEDTTPPDTTGSSDDEKGKKGKGGGRASLTVVK